MLRSLIKKGDFEKVIGQGFKLSSKYLVIYAKPNGLSYSRLGLSVSKKVGSSVVRNRIKRRLREALRKHLLENQLIFDFVVVARKESFGSEFADLDNATSNAVSRLLHEKNSYNNSKII